MVKVSKYTELKYNILNLIKENDLKPHDLIPSTSQLEKTYGVSTITIRKAIDELCTEEILYRVHGKGTYVAEAEERFLEIYTIIPSIYHYNDLPNEYTTFPLMVQFLEEHLRKNKMEMLLAIHDSNKELEKDIIQRLSKKETDGAILHYSGHVENIKYYVELSKKLSNIVFIDRYIPEINANYVVTDNLNGAYEMTKILCKKNVTKLYYMSCNHLSNTAANDRTKGVIKAASDYPNVEFVNLSAKISYGDYHKSLCDFFKKEDLNDNFAIFSDNSVVIHDLYTSLKEIFDNSKQWHLACFDKPIDDFKDNVSVVWAKQDLSEITKKAVELIAMNPIKKQQILIPAEIIIQRE